MFDVTKILPTGMIVASVVASCVYFAKGDIRHGVYWFSAAVLNLSVTY